MLSCLRGSIQEISSWHQRRVAGKVDRFPGLGKNSQVKVALCNEVLRDLSFRQQCLFSAAVGYDGLELAPFTLSETPHRLPRPRIREIRQCAEDAGLGVAGLHWLLVTPTGLSITSPDAAVRLRTRDVLLGLIDLCAELGGQVLVHGSPAERMIGPEEDRDGVFERVVDFFSEIADQAGDRNLVYCIEALTSAETNFINHLEESNELVQSVNHPAFKTMFDNRSVRAMESAPPAAVLEKWLPSGNIAHIHLNDSNSRGPGEGEDSFAEILQVAQRFNYPGWLSVEPFIYEPDGKACAARSIGFVRGLLNGLTGCRPDIRHRDAAC